MDELKRKYEASMRDVLHILGKYDYQYIKEYVEDLEKTFIQLEQSYDKLWDSVHNNPAKQKIIDDLEFYKESLETTNQLDIKGMAAIMDALTFLVKNTK